MSSRDRRYTPGLDDQHVVGHLFVDLNERFALDRHATLLQSMHGDLSDVVPTTAASGAPTLYNARTKTAPLVLHFNGGAKGQFAKYRDHLLSKVSCKQMRAYVEGGAVDTPTGPLPYQTICPMNKFDPPASRRCGLGGPGQRRGKGRLR